MRIAAASALAVAIVGSGTQAAVAQPGLQQVGTPAARPPYRRQVMIADGIAAGTIACAAAAGAWMFDPDDFHLPVMLGAFGFTSYVLTTPIIHMAHGRVGRGLLSGTIRIFLPPIVASTALSVRGLEEEDDGYGSTFMAGMAAGVAGAIALDWWLLVPDDERASAPAPRLTPVASVAPTGGLFGVAGSW